MPKSLGQETPELRRPASLEQAAGQVLVAAAVIALVGLGPGHGSLGIALAQGLVPQIGGIQTGEVVVSTTDSISLIYWHHWWYGGLAFVTLGVTGLVFALPLAMVEQRFSESS